MTDEHDAGLGVCPCCGKPLVAKCTVPGCDARVDVYSRVVGYLRPVATWNAGKQQEFRDRTEYETENYLRQTGLVHEQFTPPASRRGATDVEIIESIKQQAQAESNSKTEYTPPKDEK